MAEPSAHPTSVPESELPPASTTQTDTTTASEPQEDTEMKDSAAPTSTHAPDPPTSAPTPVPAPAAVSGKSTPHAHATSGSMPTQPSVHGGPTRIYLNQNVTPYLLDAMKHLVTREPEKPLKWLSEYLAQKSAEVEGP